MIRPQPCRCKSAAGSVRGPLPAPARIYLNLRRRMPTPHIATARQVYALNKAGCLAIVADGQPITAATAWEILAQILPPKEDDPTDD